MKRPIKISKQLQKEFVEVIREVDRWPKWTRSQDPQAPPKEKK